jgi:hypothetical protein
MENCTECKAACWNSNSSEGLLLQSNLVAEEIGPTQKDLENMKLSVWVKLIECYEKFVGEEGVEVVIFEHHDAAYTPKMQYYCILQVETIRSERVHKPVIFCQQIKKVQLLLQQHK